MVTGAPGNGAARSRGSPLTFLCGRPCLRARLRLGLPERCCSWGLHLTCTEDVDSKGWTDPRGPLVGGGPGAPVLCSARDSLSRGAFLPLPHPLPSPCGVLAHLPFLSPLFSKGPTASASLHCAHGHAGHPQRHSLPAPAVQLVTGAGAAF